MGILTRKGAMTRIHQIFSVDRIIGEKLSFSIGFNIVRE